MDLHPYFFSVPFLEQRLAGAHQGNPIRWAAAVVKHFIAVTYQAQRFV